MTRKIDRSAFLYMEPQGKPNDTFAQCGSCSSWNRSNEVCAIMDIGVHASATCAMYLEGPYNAETERILIYPEDVGYENRAVRCENCNYGVESRCQLYVQLNSMFPEMFDLDTRIDPYGCCNANTPKS